MRKQDSGHSSLSADVPIFASMIRLADTLVSDDLLNIRFACDLSACKGACCVEGDAGAPLEEEEISLLEDDLDEVLPFMTEQGRETVRETGVFEYDADANYVTPLVKGKECAFTNFDDDGIAWCAIEKAWEKGLTNFRKPSSCHLYPVRIGRYSHFDALNYHHWEICRPALKRGAETGLPLYRFLEEPLTKKYGEGWYKDLSRLLEKKP